MNEEELKKGCGKEFYTHDRIILVKCGTECKHDKRKSNQIHLCTTCQARLEYFQKGKLEQKKEELDYLVKLKEDLKQDIDKQRTDVYNNGYSDGLRDVLKYRISERIKQLQKEIGEEKQDE